MTDLDKAVSWARSFAASPLTTIAEAEALTLILTALSAQSAELAKAREAIRKAADLIDDYFMDDDYDANGKLRQVAAVLDTVNVGETND